MNKIKLAILLFLFFPLISQAQPWYVDKGGVFSSGTGAVIDGFDPVAYFVDSKAVKGNHEINVEYEGGSFFFSSFENQQLFLKDPKKYIPQYGGYCAYALAKNNKLVKVDPLMWSIVDGKLYLNYNKKIKDLWSKNIPEYIKTADHNWKQLLAKDNN